MTKTPEQMAEEFFEKWQPEKPKYIRPKARQYALEKVTECFLAGYQAAKDELLSKGMQNYINEKTNDAWCSAMQLGQQSQWISVKERLPEFCKTIVVYGPRLHCVISQLMQDEEGYSYVGPYMSVHPDEVTHWCELPELPELPKDE